MGHIRLKPSKEFTIGFNPNELNDKIVPEESKNFSKEYISSKNLAEEQNLDIMLMFDDKVMFGFDYLHLGKKRMLIEINPVTIFYANSIMSFEMLQNYKEILLSQSPEIGKAGEPINLSHSGMFFQLAINCIINLQATLESFANRIIPENYPFLNKQGQPTDRTVTFKLYNAIPKIKSIDFQQKKHRKYNISIDNLIRLRNDIIHLKPTSETNTGYKSVYRDLLDFDYSKAISSVKTFINFYEPNLIEECSCGENFYFDPVQKNK